MTGLYIHLPPSGSSLYWTDPVATAGDLPASGQLGEAKLVIDVGQIYWWNGSTWVSEDPAFFISSVLDTNSIDLTVASGVLSADLKLSAAAADANFFLNAYSVKADGLFIETRIADSTHTGVISSADWGTFNAKEPAISSGTTSQYWRGDKSFQTLNTAAIVPETGGSAAAAGKIGEIITSSVTSATTTGVGATGVYGNVTSISLTAGVWLLTGVAGFQENGATLTTSLSAGFSTSSSGGTLGTLDPAVYNNLVSSTSDLVAPVPDLDVNISSTTTYYLNTRFFYTAGTPKHYGKISARRVR